MSHQDNLGYPKFPTFRKKKLQVIELTKEDLGYPPVIKHGLLENPEKNDGLIVFNMCLMGTSSLHFLDFPLPGLILEGSLRISMEM